ncbi:TonB-dependent receptor [Pokkaliibacter sp. MBI-7]|uniref:TonB-dependent receptor n=1 Tax=Pokkaliibacter sp. MBI-7 TaxID=3040600 RepID=UPI00244AA7BD|nr:TonB-dependent receptor [Pokkaliibacter sp. MBI-7]MDH2436053.1 TonB-dependent receptor [Pokkaliibacter sp. MBI-7]
MDRKFVMAGLGYALVGLALGIYMAASKNHSQLVTHAHIMLLGFVVSFIYGVCHRLWLQNVPVRMANLQFYIHQLGTLVLLIGLFCLFAGLVPEPILGPVLGIASVIVFSGLVLMKVMFIKYART